MNRDDIYGKRGTHLNFNAPSEIFRSLLLSLNNLESAATMLLGSHMDKKYVLAGYV